jgi:hypothetical protein
MLTCVTQRALDHRQPQQVLGGEDDREAPFQDVQAGGPFGMQVLHAVDHHHQDAGDDRHHQDQVEIARRAGVMAVDDVEPPTAPAGLGGGVQLGAENGRMGALCRRGSGARMGIPEPCRLP